MDAEFLGAAPAEGGSELGTMQPVPQGGGLAAANGAAPAAPQQQRRFVTFEVVWAKFKQSPWWPAQVREPGPDQLKVKHSAGDVFVVFYGDDNQWAWMKPDRLVPFVQGYATHARHKSTKVQNAIRDAIQAIEATYKLGGGT